MTSLWAGLQNALSVINPFSQPTNQLINIPVPFATGDDGGAFFDSFMTNDSNYIVSHGLASNLHLQFQNATNVPSSAVGDDYGMIPIFSRQQNGQLVALLSPESIFDQVTIRSSFESISGTSDGSIIVAGPTYATRPMMIVWLDAIRFPNQRILVLQVPDAPDLGINFTVNPLAQPSNLVARISLDGSIIALGAATYSPTQQALNQGGMWIWKLNQWHANDHDDTDLYQLMSIVPFVDPNILAQPVTRSPSTGQSFGRGFSQSISLSGNGQLVVVGAVGLLNAAVPSGFLTVFSTESCRFYGPLDLVFPGLKDPSYGTRTALRVSGDGCTIVYATQTIVDQNIPLAFGTVPTTTGGGIMVFNVSDIDKWFDESTYDLHNLQLLSTLVQLEFLSEYAGVGVSCSNDGLNLAFSAGQAAWYYSREPDSFRYTLFHQFLDPNVQVNNTTAPGFTDSVAAVSIDGSGTWLMSGIFRDNYPRSDTNERLNVFPVYIPRSLLTTSVPQYSTLIEFK